MKTQSILAVALGLALTLPTVSHAQTASPFSQAVQATREKRYDEAVALFRNLAEASDHEAQYNLSVLLKSGRGVPQDYLNALIWAWQAQLGGIKKAADLADELFELLPEAAQQTARKKVAQSLQSRLDAGDRDAIAEFAEFNLTLMTEPDYGAAYMWYSIGSALNIDGAEQARDAAAANMTQEDIATLQAKTGTLFSEKGLAQRFKMPTK